MTLITVSLALAFLCLYSGSVTIASGQVTGIKVLQSGDTGPVSFNGRKRKGKK